MNDRTRMFLDRLSWVVVLPLAILCIPITIYWGISMEIEEEKWRQGIKETKGKHGWIAMAEGMGGVEKFKAVTQRRQAQDALMTSGLQLARRYTLRYRFVDNGKEVCTVDVSALIIQSMIDMGEDVDYKPAPLTMEEFRKLGEYEKYLKDGGYPPAMTTEELHKIREFEKYKKF